MNCLLAGSRRHCQPMGVVSGLIILVVATSRALAMTTPVVDLQRDADSVTIQTKPGTLRLQVWGDRTIHVTYTVGAKLPASLAVVGTPVSSKWELNQAGNSISLKTPAMQATVNRQTGAIQFADIAGNIFVSEATGGRTIAASSVNNKPVTGVAQEFQLADGEAIFGLGQHQDGILNNVGKALHLQQRNTDVAIPVLLSSRGYGIFWDNPSVTDVDVAKSVPGIVRWSSECGEGIDYYVFFGPEPDAVIAGYRNLTGAVPMFPRWAWGLWQSRERYKTQAEILDAARGYRQRNIPLDGMVQDWQYWIPQPWGSHAFGQNFPDPKGMTRELHDENLHMIISVWPKFDKGSKNYDELEKAGYLYSNVFTSVFPKGENKWYDPFNPGARKMYWQQMSDELFSAGVDGWWLDATEAELSGKWGEMRGVTTGAGPGYQVYNAYPLMTTTAVHDGQLTEKPDQRVFILTRSAWAGQQRNSAVTWSGDIQARWDVFQKQIPAGLNFVASGIPYWNTDIGGFFLPKQLDDGYRELFTRWFQFGAFCPMFRVHGSGFPKELWAFGPDTEPRLVKIDKLRYRLMPYIYSVSARVTREGYTMMRPLVMDFRDDAKALNVPDQFMFGPALMVNPVTKPGEINRSVYFAGKTQWRDFKTGTVYPAGQSADVPAPIETIPLMVRAGSIIPLGPDVQSTADKSDPIELRVYPGADGSFDLYEDDGLTNQYQSGAQSIIPLTWNDSARTLTIGTRRGSFPGMLANHTFCVVFVNSTKGIGPEACKDVDQQILYTGAQIQVQAPLSAGTTTQP